MKSHAGLLKLGLDADPVAATRLLKAYVSHPSQDSLTCARRLFDQVPSKDAVLWTAMISAYAQSHHPIQALHLLSEMHRHHHLHGGPRPNHYAFASAARAAGSAADPRLGATIHSQVVKHGFQSNVVVGTSILGMYSKCNDMVSARKLFEEMPYRNVVTWNSMIAGYDTQGMGCLALALFHQMRCIEFERVDEFTGASVLTACAGIGDLVSGMRIHGYFLKIGFGTDLAVVNAVVNMYFRCREVECAERAMEGREGDFFSKLVMIKGYAFNGRYGDLMRGIGGGNFVEIVGRDCSVVVSVLAACAKLSLFRTGRQVHGLIITLGCYPNWHSADSDDIVLGSALIDMYCRCSSVGEAWQVFTNLVEKSIAHWNAMIGGCIRNGLLEKARRVFNEMPERNVISWTTMISGYVQCGLPQEALSLLANLYGEGGFIQGNCFTFATALNACSCLAALDLGKQIHAQAARAMTEHGISHQVVVETALVDMYSKSGNLNYARKVFDRMKKRNVVSWSSMITAYAVHGSGFQALEVFEEMLRMGLEPNKVTFVAVLNACSHRGLVEEGVHYFKMMREKYGIVPSRDHYTCMVDMLGRAGKLAEAWSFAEEIKHEEISYNGQGGSVWGALLGGCRLHGNVEMGSKVACKILEDGQKISDTYVAISNVYADAGMWDEVYKIREEWRSRDVVKEPGLSHIQITVTS